MSDQIPVLDHNLAIKTQNLIEDIHNRDIDVVSNHIYLFGREEYVNVDSGSEPGVEYMLSNRFIRNMNIAMRANPRSPILVHMKTAGGDWQEGMAIHNMIQACPSFVTILSYTHATSMSSVILQAADRRILMPDSYFLMHQGSLGVEGTVKIVLAAVEYEKLAQIRLMEIYATRLKQKGKFQHRSMKYIKAWLKDIMDKKEDVYFTAKEAVELGFADEIFDGDWSRLTQK